MNVYARKHVQIMEDVFVIINQKLKLTQILKLLKSAAVCYFFCPIDANALAVITAELVQI